jgi:hypothetical protein
LSSFEEKHRANTHYLTIIESQNSITTAEEGAAPGRCSAALHAAGELGRNEENKVKPGVQITYSTLLHFRDTHYIYWQSK